MSVTQCPTCFRTVSVPIHLRGQTVRCPNCQAEFSAPDGGAIDPQMEKTASSQQISDQLPRPPRPRGFVDDEFDDRQPRREDYRPEQLPGGLREAAATILLGLCTVLAIAGIGVGIQRVALVDQAIVNPNAPGLQPQLEDSDTWTTGLGFIQIGAMLAAAIPFCMWMYKAHANLKFLNVSKLKYSPGWAVGGWFVPFLNLVRPCQIAQEIWKASDPAAPRNNRLWWQAAPASALIGFWWGIWIIGRILGQIAARISMHDKNGGLDTVRTVTLLNLGEDLAAIGAGLLAIGVVWAIHSRQKRKLALLNSVSDDDWDK